MKHINLTIVALLLSIAVYAIGPITGTTSVCIGASTTLSDATSGGTWSSGTPSVGTIAPLSGAFTALTAGTTVITYTAGSSSVTTTVTVNPVPASITGLSAVCVGSAITESDATGGGAWSITPSGTYATIGSSSGIVTGVFAGTPSIITYTAPTGCSTSRGVTINPLPGGITGITSICLGQMSPLFDLSAGGTWSSSSTTTASVNPLTGTTYGTTIGTANITYTLATGCLISASVSVLPLPSPISGPGNVCVSATGITYSDTTSGGIWSVSNSAIAYVNTSGVMTIFSPGADTIYYEKTSTGCIISTTVTVLPLPCTPLGLASGINSGAYQAEAQIRPNPASDMFTIVTDPGTYQTFRVINQLGQVLTRGEIKTAKTEVNISQLPPGFYHIMLNGINGLILKKLVKS